MKKVLLGVFFALLIAVGFFAGREYLPFLTSDSGKISIESNPKTTVFINGGKESDTPFAKILKPGTYEIRLLPTDDSMTTSWQKQIAINPGVETHISANLGSSENTSSWQIITMEKATRRKSGISIFSNADASEIYIDGDKKGTTPLTLPDIAEGNHELRLITPNYSESNVKFKITNNFNIQITSQLAQISPSASESATPENTNTGSTNNQSVKVLILTTPTGWLRVRSEPSKDSDELIKVKPDEEFPYIEEQEGWYKIEYETGKTGWVSSDYSKKI